MRCVLEAICCGFGTDFGPSGEPFGASWGLLGAAWAALGASWAPLGPMPRKPSLLNPGAVGHQFDVSPVWCEKVLGDLGW